MDSEKLKQAIDKQYEVVASAQHRALHGSDVGDANRLMVAVDKLATLLRIEAGAL